MGTRGSRCVVATRDASLKISNRNGPQEVELSQLAAKNHALLFQCSDGVLMTDGEGVVCEANSTAAGLLKVARRCLKGRSLIDLISARQRKTIQSKLEALQPNEVLRFGLLLAGRGARRSSAVVLRTGPGRVRQFLWLLQDRRRTSRQTAELERRVAQRTAELEEANQAKDELLIREQLARAESESANRAKDQFLAILSHELRTPLTPVLAVLSLRETDPRLSADVRDDLSMLRRNVELEARLIDDMLDLTRIGRGKLSLNCKATDIRTVIEHALEICCARETAAGRLRLIKELNAPHYHVWGDPARLVQIFWNLFRNAVKFMPNGGELRVRVWNEESPGRASAGGTPVPGDGCEWTGHKVIIEVSDTGIGIEPDFLPRLFTAFERGQWSGSQQIEGLGLGLAISRSIVDLHGGVIVAHSDGRDRGSTFRIELPTCTAPAVASVAAETPGEAGPLGRALSILLVEDHDQTSKVLARLLSDFGHGVCIAATVESAHALLNAGRFDLIISDLGLPDGSGLQVMQHARNQAIPGIALSGYGMAEDVRRCQEAGFSEHLTKPVNLEQLEQAIARAVLATEPAAGALHND